MFDPVYSVGFPGQGSFHVKSSLLSSMENRFNTDITSNVQNVFVAYAAHEERSWFPWKKFIQSASTIVRAALVPGDHSDIGGHWQCNPTSQQAAMFMMAREGSMAGIKWNDSKVDSQLAAFYNSPYSQAFVYGGSANIERWEEIVADRTLWTIPTQEEFIKLIADASPDTWAPTSPYGAQAEDGFNVAKSASFSFPILGLPGWIAFFANRNQPVLNHYPRNFREGRGVKRMDLYLDPVQFQYYNPDLTDIYRRRVSSNGEGWAP
jgi:hypothetical protein